MVEESKPIVTSTRVPVNEVNETKEPNESSGYRKEVVDDRVYEEKEDGSVVGIPVATRVQTDG